MSSYGDDFKEIAHCGGQATFHVQSDAAGKIGVSIGFRHSSPGPASWVGVYVLEYNAQPVMDFMMGGIGASFKPPMPDACWPVFLGSDSHMKWGHQCPRCKGDFRNSSHSSLYPITCPYCGLRAEAFRFLTPAQRRYIAHYIETLIGAFHTEMEPNTEKEIVIDMDQIVDQDATVPRPAFYYASESQQTQFNCAKCEGFNDIRGKFGYCADCGYRNNAADFRASMEEMRANINADASRGPELVKASVSKLDACCRDLLSQLSQRIAMKQSRRAEFERLKFHDVDNDSFKRLQMLLDVDLLRGISEADRKFLTLMLHRRHIYEHTDGVADDRYVRVSGDTDARTGVLIREQQGNVHRLVGLLTRMVQNMQSDFHEIFPLTEWPIAYAESTRRRTTAQ